MTACDSTRVVEKPVIHEVVKTEWRTIPDDLTTVCEKSVIDDEMTYGDAINAWARDRASIDACNGKLIGIRRLAQQ